MGRFTVNTMLSDSLNLLFDPNDVVELRALGKRKNEIQSGYFKDHAKLSEIAHMLDVTGEHKGIYIVLNKINPALYARSPDKLTPARAQPTTTADQDITRRVWLPVDFDPIRPSDISSTDEEHEAALTRAREVRDTLKEMGWPDPILADSGNGAHLLYKIDLPNDEDSKILIDHVLKAFDALFSDDKVSVDLKVFNAARIWKMYGTATRKGEHILERPWRSSKIIEVPTEIKTVGKNLLELEAWAWEQKNQAERFNKPNEHKRNIQLGQWLASHGIDVVKEKTSKSGGTIYVLECCPWNSSHTDRSAFVVQHKSGTIVAGCQHTGCEGKGWKDLQGLYEPVVEQPEQPHSVIHEPISQIILTDVADVEYGEGDKDDKVKFSPDKAADAITQYLNIISTPDERIWVYSDGIYVPNGDVVIDRILDQVAGDYYTLRAAKETQRKIVLRCMEEFKVFNSNPYLFCIKNGVIDMQTGKFLEHSPEYRLTLKSPVIYDETATCPEIAAFLRNSLGSDDNILSVLDILTAKTTTMNFEYFAAAIGEGSNGKSVLEELIRKFYGDEQIAEVEIATLTQNRFDKIQLHDKRFLINSEVAGDIKESRTIKAISGGMRIDADQKNKNHIQFRPHCFILIDTNNPPRFADNTHGFERRLVKIDFPHKFVDNPMKDTNEKKRDPLILEKISLPKETSGLLNILIANGKRVFPGKKIHRRGTGKELAEEYDLQANSVAAFYDKFVEEADDMYNISTVELYGWYKKFCTKIKASPVRDRDFFGYARKHYHVRKGRQDVAGSGKIRVFYGIDINDESIRAFINTTKGPSLDHQNQYQDHQDHIDQQNRILDLLNGNNLYKENKDVFDGPAGSPGPDSEIDGILAGTEMTSYIERALAVITKIKGKLTPFLIADRVRTLGAIVTPKQAAAWLIANGYEEQDGTWIPKHA